MSDRKVGVSAGPKANRKSSRSSPAAKPRGKHGAHIGRALRSVYDETLREDVPDDFMDLLGKLS